MICLWAKLLDLITSHTCLTCHPLSLFEMEQNWHPWNPIGIHEIPLASMKSCLVNQWGISMIFPLRVEVDEPNINQPGTLVELKTSWWFLNINVWSIRNPIRVTSFSDMHQSQWPIPSPKPKYCWWLKSCTTWDVWNPTHDGIFTISIGAGFQPSTVVFEKSEAGRLSHFLLG